MKIRSRSFRKVSVLFLAGLLATQLSLTALADTAADTAGTDITAAVPGPAVETFTLGGLLIEVEAVDVPASATGLVYNGKEQKGASLPDLDKKYKLRSGAKSAVKPGSYTMELELAEPLPETIAQQIREGNAGRGMPATPSDYTAVCFYTWKDRSIAPVTIRWSIEALKTKGPEGKKLTYTGKEQTGVTEGNGYTLSGNKAVKPGSYKAAAKLAEGYVWEDGTSKDLEVEWSIAALKAKAPEGKKLTYTGKEQTGVEAPENCGYTLSGNKETKAGTYKAVAKLAEGYVWEDGSRKDLEIEWSIVRKSSGGGSSGGGGSGGTGQKGLMVVRPDGSVSTYGGTDAGTSYSNGSSATSPGAYAGNPPGQPAGTALVQNDPSVPTPAPGSLSGNSVPSSSKLPQDTGNASVQQNTTASDSKKTSGNTGSSPGSSGSTKKEGSADAAEKTAASAASEVSKEHAETEETKAGTVNETLVAAEESSVIFEFGPAAKEDPKDASADNTGIPAVQKPESFADGLMSVVWKILAVLGVLAIAGGSGYMIYSRKRDKWDE